jgi:hypothetical protein
MASAGRIFAIRRVFRGVAPTLLHDVARSPGCLGSQRQGRDQMLDPIVRNAEWLLFVGVLANQAGVPVPVTPWLLAAGALAASGQVSLVALVAGGAGAALCADLGWYGLGRWRGAAALASLLRALRQPPATVDRVVRIESNRGQPVGRHGSGAAALPPPRDRECAHLGGGMGRRRIPPGWDPCREPRCRRVRGWPDRARSGGGRRRCARLPGMASATPGSP